MASLKIVTGKLQCQGPDLEYFIIVHTVLWRCTWTFSRLHVKCFWEILQGKFSSLRPARRHFVSTGMFHLGSILGLPAPRIIWEPFCDSCKKDTFPTKRKAQWGLIPRRKRLGEINAELENHLNNKLAYYQQYSLSLKNNFRGELPATMAWIFPTYAENIYSHKKFIPPQRYLKARVQIPLNTNIPWERNSLTLG